MKNVFDIAPTIKLWETPVEDIKLAQKKTMISAMHDTKKFKIRPYYKPISINRIRKTND